MSQRTARQAIASMLAASSLMTPVFTRPESPPSPRQPSGKNRDKIKAARRQSRKTRKKRKDTPND